MSQSPRLCLCAALMAFVPIAYADERPAVKVMRTPGGVRFGVLGDKPKSPAPTLFVFATTPEQTLPVAAYNQVGTLLAKDGWLCVALDVPCHGEDAKKGEPAGLDGWRARVQKGEPLVGDFTKQVVAVLDHLVKEGWTDPKHVAACGTSRGGFMALHVSAAEPRVKCVAAFAPVTHLSALREFKGLEDHAGTKALSLTEVADKLAGRPVWVCIGNSDERVGTDHVIAFTRKVTAASVARKQPAAVELHVMPVPGHTVHATAHTEAAAWIAARMKETK